MLLRKVPLTLLLVLALGLAVVGCLGVPYLPPPPPNEPPQASLTLSPDWGDKPLTVTADASASSDPDGTIVRYDYDFGDGTLLEDAGPSAQHTYTAPDVYTVTVTVTDDRGAQAQAQAQVVVSTTVAGWEAVSTSPKTGAYGEAVVGTGQALYLMRCWSTGTSSYWWRYDGAWTELKNWSDLSSSDLPRCKTGTALAWDFDRFIYVLFGASYSDSDRRYFYRYDLVSDTWERLADTPHPQGAGDALVWSGYDRKLYAFLGSNVHGTAFARYSPETDTWELLTLNPSWAATDDGAALAWAGGEHLYALQGEEDESVPNQSFARYHIPTGAWEDLPAIPEAQGVGDGASLLWIGPWLEEEGLYLFALGGGNTDESPGYHAYRYRLRDNTWETLPDIPYPVGWYVGNRLGFFNGQIYYWQGAPSTWDGGGDQLVRALWR